MRPLIIAPSILSADFAKLGEEVRASRGGRRRLDPRRRDGRALRAQHHHRPGGGEGDPPAHQEDARRPSDDRALRSLSRSLRQGRLRHHHRACRGRPARAPLAAGDPRARQEGRRHASTRRRRSSSIEHVIDHGRSGPGDVGQSRLRRPGLHPGRARQDLRDVRALVGARPIDIEVDGGVTAAERRRGGARRRQRAGRRLRRVQGRQSTPTAATSRRSATPPRWRAGKRRD